MVAFFCYFSSFIIQIISILIAVAYFTLYERKLMGHVQRRKGPNTVGFWGLLQPISDGVKLLLKEIILPTASNYLLFLCAPIVSLFLSFIMWSTLPLGIDYVLVDINLTILFFFITSSFGVYAVVLSGWSSNSIYAFLGAIRSTAQMISYEVCLGFVLIILTMYSGSANITDIVLAQEGGLWFGLLLFPVMLVFFICIIAETNRAPFDLPEAEAEIVAGYNVEYSSMTFAMFFLAEYSNILLMCSFFVAFFWGGWLPPLAVLGFIPGSVWFILKTVICVMLFILIRAALPRYRYDMLMSIGWKVFLPFTFALVFFYSGYLYALNAFPIVDHIIFSDQYLLYLIHNIKIFNSQQMLFPLFFINRLPNCYHYFSISLICQRVWSRFTSFLLQLKESCFAVAALSPFFFDLPSQNQLLFQDPATPVMEGIVCFHHDIMVILIVIGIFVLWMLSTILVSFRFEMFFENSKSFIPEWSFRYLYNKRSDQEGLPTLIMSDSGLGNAFYYRLQYMLACLFGFELIENFDSGVNKLVSVPLNSNKGSVGFLNLANFLYGYKFHRRFLQKARLNYSAHDSGLLPGWSFGIYDMPSFSYSGNLARLNKKVSAQLRHGFLDIVSPYFVLQHFEGSIMPRDYSPFDFLNAYSLDWLGRTRHAWGSLPSLGYREYGGQPSLSVFQNSAILFTYLVRDLFPVYIKRATFYLTLHLVRFFIVVLRFFFFFISKLFSIFLSLLQIPFCGIASTFFYMSTRLYVLLGRFFYKVMHYVHYLKLSTRPRDGLFYTKYGTVSLDNYLRKLDNSLFPATEMGEKEFEKLKEIFSHWLCWKKNSTDGSYKITNYGFSTRLGAGSQATQLTLTNCRYRYLEAFRLSSELSLLSKPSYLQLSLWHPLVPDFRSSTAVGNTAGFQVLSSWTFIPEFYRLAAGEPYGYPNQFPIFQLLSAVGATLYRLVSLFTFHLNKTVIDYLFIMQFISLKRCSITLFCNLMDYLTHTLSSQFLTRVLPMLVHDTNRLLHDLSHPVILIVGKKIFELFFLPYLYRPVTLGGLSKINSYDFLPQLSGPLGYSDGELHKHYYVRYKLGLPMLFQERGVYSPIVHNLHRTIIKNTMNRHFFISEFLFNHTFGGDLRTLVFPDEIRAFWKTIFMKFKPDVTGEGSTLFNTKPLNSLQKVFLLSLHYSYSFENSNFMRLPEGQDKYEVYRVIGGIRYNVEYLLYNFLKFITYNHRSRCVHSLSNPEYLRCIEMHRSFIGFVRSMPPFRLLSGSFSAKHPANDFQDILDSKFKVVTIFVSSIASFVYGVIHILRGVFLRFYASHFIKTEIREIQAKKRAGLPLFLGFSFRDYYYYVLYGAFCCITIQLARLFMAFLNIFAIRLCAHEKFFVFQSIGLETNSFYREGFQYHLKFLQDFLSVKLLSIVSSFGLFLSGLMGNFSLPESLGFFTLNITPGRFLTTDRGFGTFIAGHGNTLRTKNFFSSCFFSPKQSIIGILSVNISRPTSSVSGYTFFSFLVDFAAYSAGILSKVYAFIRRSVASLFLFSKRNGDLPAFRIPYDENGKRAYPVTYGLLDKELKSRNRHQRLKISAARFFITRRLRFVEPDIALQDREASSGVQKNWLFSPLYFLKSLRDGSSASRRTFLNNYKPTFLTFSFFKRLSPFFDVRTWGSDTFSGAIAQSSKPQVLWVGGALPNYYRVNNLQYAPSTHLYDVIFCLSFRLNSYAMGYRLFSQLQHFLFFMSPEVEQLSFQTVGLFYNAVKRRSSLAFILYGRKTPFSSIFQFFESSNFRRLWVKAPVHNTKLEIIWTLIPAAILLHIALPSLALLYAMDEVRSPSFILKAIGNQWYWSYEYENIFVTNNLVSEEMAVVDLTPNFFKWSLDYESRMLGRLDDIYYMIPLELGRPRLLEVDNHVIIPERTHIRIAVSSNDVLHSWAVPSAGIKVDACPGRLNQVGAFFKRCGVFYGQCSEICGVNHAFMPIVLEVVPQDSFVSAPKGVPIYINNSSPSVLQ